MLAVSSIFIPISESKPVFFVSNNKYIRNDKANASVLNQGNRRKEPALSEQDEHYTNIHRIPDITIGANDDELVSFIEWRQGTFTYTSK